MRKTFDEALDSFEDNSIDLLHIDGLHTYDAVKHDFESCFPKVKKGGIILLHYIFISRDDFGVYQLCEELKGTYKTIEFYHSYGLGVLFKEEFRYPALIKQERQWQIRYSSIAEDRKNERTGDAIRGLQRSLAERNGQIVALSQAVTRSEAEIYQSLSWRVTAPMRYVGRLIRKFRFLLPLTVALFRNEPFVPFMTKILEIFRREGVGGIKARIRRRHFGGKQTRGIGSIGNKEGTFSSRRLPAIEAARPLENDYSVSVPFDFAATLNMPKREKVAVVVHLYYEELASEMLSYLVNIPFDIDVYISTTDSSKASVIECVFSKWNKGSVEIRVAPNRGRDIAPKLVSFSDVYNRYEYILFLHGKKSNHADVSFYWRHFLLESLVGTPDVIKSILHLFEQHPNIGIMGAQHFEPMRHWIDWGGNFPTAKILAEKMGFIIKERDPLDFPAGSMFWARSKALKPLIDMGLKVDDFEVESNQLDATLAHAIERIFFHVCEHAGFDWIKIARPEFYNQTPNIVEIKTEEDLSAFLDRHLFRLLNPRGVKPRSVAPPPVTECPSRFLDCLRRRALGIEINTTRETRVALGLVTYNNTENNITAAITAAEHSLGSAGLGTRGALFLIDNGASTERVTRSTESVTRLKSFGNVGFGAGHNKLMDAAFNSGYEIYITINPDGLLHPEAVRALVQAVQAARGKALVEALQFPVEHPKPYDPHTLDTPWASGACLAIPSEIYEVLGGFDKSFFMFCEDVDLSWRARAHGYAVKTCPRALFLHAVTNRATDPEIIRMSFESGIILARKWGSPEFEEWLRGELDLLGKTVPEHFPATVPYGWRRFSDFSHHFTFASPRW